MKNKFLSLLMVALVCGIGMSVTSCKDDDDSNSEEQQQKEAEAKAQASEKFWGVVGQLISYTDITDEYKDKTFEPNIGRPAEGDALTRIVATNTLEAAVEQYNDLTGAGITTSTATHTYDDPDVGTLTYTKSTDGKSWATVDVDIKQMPHLTKIVYQSYEQGNTNGSFEGKAYYRFGDIVRVMEIMLPTYWICVRPAFGNEKKEDSHWVTISALPEEDYIHKVNVDDKNTWSGSPYKFWLPTKLGTNKEHMRNFAEMLFAICNPNKWQFNVSSYGPTGMPVFHDFSYKNVRYHNEYFWKNVQIGWAEKNVFNSVLNLRNGLQELKAMCPEEPNNANPGGIRLLYNGYSWPWGSTCTLYEAVYTNGTKEKERNMHHEELISAKKDMRAATGDIDFRYGGGTIHFDEYKEFFNNDGKCRWVIRHATGEELAKKYGNGRYDPKQPIDGVEEFYRYYRDVLPTNNLTTDPEESQPASSLALEKPKTGCLIGPDGRFYDKTDTKVKAVAVVVYLGEKGTVESGTNYNGLAIATENFANLNWQDSEDANQCNITPIRADWSNCTTNLDGLASTLRLSGGCGNLNHKHQAAQKCAEYNVISANNRTENRLSDWFIPSTGQWALVLKYMGCQVNQNEFTGKTLANVNEVFGNKEGKLVANTPYMTSTVVQNDNTKNVALAASTSMFGFRLFPSLYDGSGKAQVLQPFIAFEFDGWVDKDGNGRDDDDDDILY